MLDAHEGLDYKLTQRGKGWIRAQKCQGYIHAHEGLDYEFAQKWLGYRFDGRLLQLTAGSPNLTDKPPPAWK